MATDLQNVSINMKISLKKRQESISWFWRISRLRHGAAPSAQVKNVHSPTCSEDNFIFASVHWTNISFSEGFTACHNKQKVKLTLWPSTMQWRHFLKCADGVYTLTALPLGEEPPVPTSQETVHSVKHIASNAKIHWQTIFQSSTNSNVLILCRMHFL